MYVILVFSLNHVDKGTYMTTRVIGPFTSQEEAELAGKDLITIGTQWWRVASVEYGVV